MHKVHRRKLHQHYHIIQLKRKVVALIFEQTFTSPLVGLAEREKYTKMKSDKSLTPQHCAALMLPEVIQS